MSVGYRFGFGFCNLAKKALFSIFIAFLLTKISKLYHFAWNFFKNKCQLPKIKFKKFWIFFRNSKTKICHNFNQNMDFWVKIALFLFFGKLSVFSVIKVGYRFYSVIRISVTVRFRLDQIWSVSVRLSVNRLFEPITNTK